MIVYTYFMISIMLFCVFTFMNPKWIRLNIFDAFIWPVTLFAVLVFAIINRKRQKEDFHEKHN